MENLRLTVVIGTAREERFSDRVASDITKLLQKKGSAEVSLVDTKDFTFGHTVPSWVENERAEIWRKIVEDSDGFVFVVPEYNRSYPGELKILLDSAYKQYNRKPVLVVAVSSGNFAGVRMFEHIQPVLTELGLVIAPRPILVSKVEELYNGSAAEEERKAELWERSENNLDSLLWYAQALKTAREPTE